MLYFCVLFSCCMKISLPVFCLCCVLGVKKYRKTKNYVLYFSARQTRSSVLCYIFPRVERALVLLGCIFCVWNALWQYCFILTCMWNALWHYCVIFFAHGRRSGVIVLYFPRLERDLTLLCYIFRVWNALWR